MSDLVVIPDGLHSPLGPSAAERWLECPGSVLASRGLREEPTQYALEGTAAHTVSEWCRERKVPASDFWGFTIRVQRGAEHWDVRCDKAMVESVQTFVDKMAQIPGDELCEYRVDFEEWVTGGFGTLDGAKLGMRLGHIVDFKHGKGVQKWARMNPQLMLYALGVYREFNWIYEFQGFLLYIYQPRLDHFDDWYCSTADLLAWARGVVVPGAVRALTPGSPFRAGSWCQFCALRKSEQGCETYKAYKSSKGRGHSDTYDDLDE